MKERKVDRPVEFLESLGGLHDVRVNKILFDTISRTLILSLNDIYANFTDTAEYKGHIPCEFVFEAVTAFSFNIESGEGIRISNAEVSKNSSAWRLEIDLNLGGASVGCGSKSIAVSFGVLHLRGLA